MTPKSGVILIFNLFSSIIFVSFYISNPPNVDLPSLISLPISQHKTVTTTLIVLCTNANSLQITWVEQHSGKCFQTCKEQNSCGLVVLKIVDFTNLVFYFVLFYSVIFDLFYIILLNILY